MANCHHRRRVSPLSLAFFFLCLSCITAIAALCACPQPWPLVSSSFLQASSCQEHLQSIQLPNTDEAYFLSPGAASLQGRRPYQEDRLLCAPALHLPSSAPGIAGLFGVFDGHLGDEASEFASRSITGRFLHHASSGVTASMNISSMAFQWLESALLAAISDIDTGFERIAAAHDLKSGSTASVALQVHDQILVANLGDSRAFFCSSCVRKKHSRGRLKYSYDGQGLVRSRRGSRHQVSRRVDDSVHSEGFCVKRLTSDHKPDRPDERVRIEASGGFVTNGSTPRVNGELAVSRSIGDINLRRYGVISEPEVSGWHQVSENDKFLVLASDGIFEKMSSEEVCDVLHALGSGLDLTSVVDLFEKSKDAVIALPGTSSGKHTSNQDARDFLNGGAHTFGAGVEPLTTSSPQIVTQHAWQGDDSSVRTLIPTLLGAPGYAQILAQIIVEVALRMGSMDNLSTIVVPLKAQTM